MRLDRRAVLGISAVVGASTLGWFAACFSCSSPSEQLGPDGAAHDVAADGRPLGDAGRYLDTGTDARVDARPPPPCDGSAPLDTPELPSTLWQPLPGLPACCGERVAIDPELADPPFKWEPCATGTGCEKAVGSWKRGSGGTYDTWTPEPLRYSEGAQILSYSRLEEDIATATFGRVVAIVQVLTPAPKRLLATAWDMAAGTYCGPGPFWGPRGSLITSSGIGALLPYLGFLPPGKHAAADIDLMTLPMYSGKGPEIPVVGPKAAFFELGAPSYIGVSMDLATRAFTTQPRSDLTANLRAYGDGAVGRHSEPTDFFPSGLGYVGPDGKGAPLLKASPGRYVFGLAVDRKQGEALVWVEAPDLGGFGGPLDLWTAPYAVPPAAPQKRLVMKDPQSSGGFFALMVAHDGLALFVRKRNQAHLVRLSDGMGWILNAEPGTDFARPLGITDEHVMLFTAKQICPTCTVQRQDSLIRFSRAALGPPTEPNGL